MSTACEARRRGSYGARQNSAAGQNATVHRMPVADRMITVQKRQLELETPRKEDRAWVATDPSADPSVQDRDAMGLLVNLNTVALPAQRPSKKSASDDLCSRTRSSAFSWPRRRRLKPNRASSQNAF